MSSVAILFILEIDDVFFAVWIPDATKVRIERFRKRSVSEADGEEAALLTATKQAHTVLFSCAILFPVLAVAVLSLMESESIKRGEKTAYITPFIAAWMGAILEWRVTQQKITGVIAGAITGLLWIMFAMGAQHSRKGLFYGDIEGGD
eukprot:COSAG03_NODE_1685_length_3648_cov_226.387997_3_plen_148_part_00